MLTTVLYSLALLSATAFSNPINNTIYVISNAERPSLDLPGLTPVGWQRASQCIPSIFSNISLGAIVACTPDSKHSDEDDDWDNHDGCKAANITATPLAQSLGLVPDTSCRRVSDDDDHCLKRLLANYSQTLDSTQSILLVWDNTEMDDLMDYLNIELPGDEDDDDIADMYASNEDIILIKNGGGGRKDKAFVASMNCTGIDGQQPGTF